MAAFAEPRVVCRPSLPADTEDVLAFTRHIWDGRDYIHLVWDEWLADPNGILVSAQYGRHVVGMAKVSPVTPEQWWLHGLRVDPKYQGRKIGSHLHEYANAWWLEHGGGTIRLLTSTKRVQVHHLCERTGYQRVGEIITYRRTLAAAPPLEGTAGEFAAATAEDVPEAVEFLRKHSRYIGGLIDTGWRFVAPEEAILSEAQRTVHLHWWRGREGLVLTWEGDDDEGPVLGIGAAAAREAGRLADVLRLSPGLAQGKPVEALFWLAPREARVQTALEAAGFVTDEDSGVLFERRQGPT